MYQKAMPAGSAGIIAASYGMEAILGHVATPVTPEEPVIPEEPVFTPVVYAFESYDSTGEIKYATGTVETTNETIDGKTKVKVLTNVAEPGIQIPDTWVGQYFLVNSNALVNSNNLYVLYDTNGDNTGVKVKIASV